MVLFITIPFIGGWIGYRLAPEKIVEVQTMIERQSIATTTAPVREQAESSQITDPKYVVQKNVVSSSVYGNPPYDREHLIFKGDIRDDSLVGSPNNKFLLFIHEPLNGTEDIASAWIYDFAKKTTQRVEFYGDEQAPYVVNWDEDSIGPMQQIRYRKSVAWTEDNRIVYIVEYEGKEYRYESAPLDEPWCHTCLCLHIEATMLDEC